MPRLPTRFAGIILSFAPLFFQRSWRYAEVLLIGAILAPGKRTVTSLLRITGLSRERRFVNYHRVLSRAAWSERLAARLLLCLLLDAFVPSGPVILGIDDMIERRRGHPNALSAIESRSARRATLRAEVQAVALAELARAGTQWGDRTAVVRRFEGRGASRATLFRYIDAALQTGAADAPRGTA